MQSLGFQLHATKRDLKLVLKRLNCYASLETKVSVMLNVSSNTLQQVERFRHLGVIFKSDGRQNKEIDTGIGEANAVLCELYRSVVTKQELSNIVKLSGFKWVFVQILPYGHESWVT